MSELPHEAYLAALASLDGVGPGRLRVEQPLMDELTA